jgi:DNA-binding NtrC family response regulator
LASSAARASSNRPQASSAPREVARPPRRPRRTGSRATRPARGPPRADLLASIRGHLGGAYNPPAPVDQIKPLDELLTEVERRVIETAMRQSRSNKSRTAEILGISRPRLYRRIKELNLPDEDDPAEDDGPAE